MNRNNEQHFLQIPEMHASRTRFNRDQTVLTTFDAGKLIPFFVDEVLPGDTFQVDTSAIIRMTTPKYPVMDDAYIDLYYFYAPNRILWDNFKHFMGEVEQTPWMPKKTYEVPQMLIPGTAEKPMPQEKTILDYMGVPTKIKKNFEINALPIRAYVKIWNEFFRDQNVDNEAVYYTDDREGAYPAGLTSNENEVPTDQLLKQAIQGGYCLPVNRFHDYFTSCLPYPQRGPEVNISLTGNAPVFFSDSYTGGVENAIDRDIWLNSSGTGTFAARITNTETYNGKSPLGRIIGVKTNGGSSTNSDQADSGFMWTNLQNVQATTINQLREAVAVQQYYEALARGGSRYREQVQALWNVEISDKTVQVPEYLGGGRYHVNVNQIIQTSGQQTTNDTPIGETGAVSVTPINESSFTKSFEEHGFVLGVACVRHNRSYQQGLERFWSRKDRLDYYIPQFANLGEQPVKKKEIMLTGEATDEETFGYQEAWADYRMKPNRVSGRMRSNASGTLDFWHYADNYAKVPTLSQEWMAEGKSEIARTLIVQDEPQFFGAIRIANKTTRRMPLYSVPGLYKL